MRPTRRSSCCSSTGTAAHGRRPPRPRRSGRPRSPPASPRSARTTCGPWAATRPATRRTWPRTGTATAWSIVPTPDITSAGDVQDLLTGVSSDAAGDVWASGYAHNVHNQNSFHEPYVLHWTGTKWVLTKVPTLGTEGSLLNGIQVLSPADAWAVGLAAGTRRPALRRLTSGEFPCGKVPPARGSPRRRNPMPISSMRWRAASALITAGAAAAAVLALAVPAGASTGATEISPEQAGYTATGAQFKGVDADVLRARPGASTPGRCEFRRQRRSSGPLTAWSDALLHSGPHVSARACRSPRPESAPTSAARRGTRCCTPRRAVDEGRRRQRRGADHLQRAHFTRRWSWWVHHQLLANGQQSGNDLGAIPADLTHGGTKFESGRAQNQQTGASRSGLTGRPAGR